MDCALAQADHLGSEAVLGLDLGLDSSGSLEVASAADCPNSHSGSLTEADPADIDPEIQSSVFASSHDHRLHRKGVPHDDDGGDEP